MDLDSYIIILVLLDTFGIDIDKESWNRLGIMLYAWTQGTDLDSWYRLELMV